MRTRNSAAVTLAAAAAAAMAISFAGTTSAAVFYEPFDYAEGNLGLNVNPSVNQTWYSSAANPTTATDDRVQVVAGSLSTAGLPASVGNKASLGGGGRTDRIFLGQNYTSANSTSVYWSTLFKVTDLTGTTATGVTIFGFNNTAQTAPGSGGSFEHDVAVQPGTVSGRLTLKPGVDAGTYILGASKASGSVGTWDWVDEKPINVGDTVYLVGRYTFNTGSSTDDVFDLWINPSPATFADDSLVPTPDASMGAAGFPGEGSADGGTIATIILRQTAGLPPGMEYDEIRVDTQWAHVTSNLVPEPSATALALGAAGAVLLRRRPARR